MKISYENKQMNKMNKFFPNCQQFFTYSQKDNRDNISNLLGIIDSDKNSKSKNKNKQNINIQKCKFKCQSKQNY